KTRTSNTYHFPYTTLFRSWPRGREPMKTQVKTLAIVGAGSVGATIGYAAMIRGAARRIVLYDIDSKKVKAQALDLAHGLQFVPRSEEHTSELQSRENLVCR